MIQNPSSSDQVIRPILVSNSAKLKGIILTKRIAVDETNRVKVNKPIETQLEKACICATNL
jgi:hypothetical protein